MNTVVDETQDKPHPDTIADVYTRCEYVTVTLTFQMLKDHAEHLKKELEGQQVRVEVRPFDLHEKIGWMREARAAMNAARKTKPKKVKAGQIKESKQIELGLGTLAPTKSSGDRQ